MTNSRASPTWRQIISLPELADAQVGHLGWKVKNARELAHMTSDTDICRDDIVIATLKKTNSATNGPASLTCHDGPDLEREDVGPMGLALAHLPDGK